MIETNLKRIVSRIDRQGKKEKKKEKKNYYQLIFSSRFL